MLPLIATRSSSCRRTYSRGLGKESKTVWTAAPLGLVAPTWMLHSRNGRQTGACTARFKNKDPLRFEEQTCTTWAPCSWSCHRRAYLLADAVLARRLRFLMRAGVRPGSLTPEQEARRLPCCPGSGWLWVPSGFFPVRRLQQTTRPRPPG